MDNLNIDSFLRTGDIIRTKKYGVEKWNTNIVFDVKDDKLLLDAGINEDCFKQIKMGDEMECEVTKNDCEYTIKGCVSEVSTNPIQVMILRIEGIKKYNNLRKDLRHFVYLFALVKKEKNDTNPTFAAVTDISKGGVAVLVSNKQDMVDNFINDKAYFEVSLEDQRVIRFEGLIRRKKQTDKGIEYGIQIKEIDGLNENILNDYVDELQNTDEEFQQLKQEIWEYNFEL